MAPRSPAACRRGEAGGRELLAVEGRTLEEVAELGPVALGVDRELLAPRARFHLSFEHQPGPPSDRCS